MKGGTHQFVAVPWHVPWTLWHPGPDRSGGTPRASWSFWDPSHGKFVGRPPQGSEWTAEACEICACRTSPSDLKTNARSNESDTFSTTWQEIAVWLTEEYHLKLWLLAQLMGLCEPSHPGTHNFLPPPWSPDSESPLCTEASSPLDLNIVKPMPHL